MESARIQGGAEEKSSCESGWTMYIEDTFHGNHHSDDNDDHEDDYYQEKEADDPSSDNESDDSMTSDASSWPSSTQLPRNTKDQAPPKNTNVKQVNHQTKTRACETSSEEGEESQFKATTRTTAASRVHSRGKVRKTK